MSCNCLDGSFLCRTSHTQTLFYSLTLPPPLNTQMLFYFFTPSTPLLPKSSNTFLLLVKFHRPACHLGGTLNWKTCLIFNSHPTLTDFSQIEQIEQALKDLVFSQRPNIAKKSPAPFALISPITLMICKTVFLKIYSAMSV